MPTTVGRKGEFIGIIKKSVKQCCKCDRPVLSVHSMYCLRCARLAFRMKVRRFSPDAVEEVWKYLRAFDYRCFYTKLPLEMQDIRSPWFCVFDHLIPLDPNHIVLTCALINEMKSALSEREFWFYVEQLADFIDQHKKIKKIKLAYWRHSSYGHGKGKCGRGRIIDWGPRGRGNKCDLCGRPVFNVHAKYCLRCSHFAHRLELQGFGKKTVEDILDHVRRRGFTCFYTGMPLDMTDDRSPWYGVFDRVTPGDPSKVVLTSALFNEMKSDLSIKEFWYYIRQLANYKRYHSKIRKKKLVYWYRLTSKELYFKSFRD